MARGLARRHASRRYRWLPGGSQRRCHYAAAMIGMTVRSLPWWVASKSFTHKHTHTHVRISHTHTHVRLDTGMPHSPIYTLTQTHTQNTTQIKPAHRTTHHIIQNTTHLHTTKLHHHKWRTSKYPTFTDTAQKHRRGFPPMTHEPPHRKGLITEVSLSRSRVFTRKG